MSQQKASAQVIMEKLEALTTQMDELHKHMIALEEKERTCNTEECSKSKLDELIKKVEKLDQKANEALQIAEQNNEQEKEIINTLNISVDNPQGLKGILSVLVDSAERNSRGMIKGESKLYEQTRQQIQAL